MKRNTNQGQKIAVLGTSFALFLLGVAALSLERGAARTAMLAAALAGLLAVALVQTLRKRRKEKE